MRPLEQLMHLILTETMKLLVDHRILRDGLPASDNNYDDAPYLQSQFNRIYGDKDANNQDQTPNDSRFVAYSVDQSQIIHRHSYKPADGELGNGPYYPLSMQETLDLQDLRILDYVQLGFVPIEDLDAIEKPTLYIANATDRNRPDGQVVPTTTKQVNEIIPINFRLCTKQPADYNVSTTNIVVVDKVIEGLKYVLDPFRFINMVFERRGYSMDTVITNIEFLQALNLEEFLSPYEVCDILFRITVKEQITHSENFKPIRRRPDG